MNGRVYVAGHRGLVGSALVRRLGQEAGCQVLTRTRAELDLTDARSVDAFFAAERPEYVFLAAAKVGGIAANATYPVEFLSENMKIQLNVMESAHRHGVTKLLFLGSSCIYPKLAPQPISEDSLLTGPLEPTNEAYAIAKIAGIKLCQAYRTQYGERFISAMPTNLYGPGDNFDLESSHVLPALIRKCHEAAVSGASTLPVWGSGTPRREFLHVDDLADACVLLMREYEGADPINVGAGKDITIRELAQMVADVVGFAGRLEFDASRPDGAPRKLLDTARITALGWQPRIPLRDGIAETYEWFRSTVAQPHGGLTA
jgi:GDP-L-fucose synthase